MLFYFFSVKQVLNLKELQNVRLLQYVLMNWTLFNFFSQNILEITVSDDDIVHDDDHAIVLFDVAKVPLGERVFTTFPLNPEVRTRADI